MPRPIEHTGFTHRNFDDVVLIFERHAADILGVVTAAASLRSTSLVRAAEVELPNFDSDEQLGVNFLPIEKDRQHAWIEFTWDADTSKRLLANVTARIDFRPLVRHGPMASTELALRARYDPAAATRRSPETALFGRRVVKAALLRLLETTISTLDDYEESIFA